MSVDVFEPPRTPLKADEGAREAIHSLEEMDFATVKRLRNASHSIRALGALWLLSAVVLLAALSGMLHEGAAPSAALLVLAAFLLIFVAALYAAWARPVWGRGMVIAVCVLIVFNIGLGTIIGILGLLAAAPSSSQRLFGPMGIPHRAVADRFRELKRARKRALAEDVPLAGEDVENPYRNG